MIGNSKPLASLSSGLLARKGQAKPAMRPQGFVSITPAAHEDLGWNDMGEDTAPAPAPVAEPVIAPQPGLKPVVLRQREALDEKLAQPEPQAVPVPEPALQSVPEPQPEPVPAAPAPTRSARGMIAQARREAPEKKGKAAFTLRLDSQRHLRLRLASAVTNQSAQLLVTQALDQFLESIDDVEALASQIGSARERG